jgi:hypothetical protein
VSAGRLIASTASAALLLLAGCAAIPASAPPESAAAKRFHVEAHEAAIYVIRSERVGGAIPLQVLIDGQHLGATVARSYLYAVVPPGIHTVESRGDIRSTLEVNAKPGTITYLSQVVELTYLSSPRTRLRPVTESQGREWVLELKAAPPR